MSNNPIILFDLGGVLIELGKSVFPSEWLEDDKRFALPEWFKSESAQQFEKGQISASEFATAIKKDLSLKASIDDICTEFAQWPIGQYQGIDELLMTLKKSYTLAILTNTNELHWPRIIDEFKIPKYSDHIYSSHQIKLAKPNPKIYEYVLNELEASPESVIFFDDNLQNIQAAKNVGIQSYLVKGPIELMSKLLSLGILE